MLWRDRLEMFDGFSGLVRTVHRVLASHEASYLRVHDNGDLARATRCRRSCFDDEYSFGILQSSAHWQWFLDKVFKTQEPTSATSTESVFNTFPWPQITDRSPGGDRGRGGARDPAHPRRGPRRPSEASLRALYRTLELPGKNPLKDAHAALDAAVLDAYGFIPEGKPTCSPRLLALNLAVAERIQAGQPVTAPGVPALLPQPRRPHHPRLHSTAK